MVVFRLGKLQGVVCQKLFAKNCGPHKVATAMGKAKVLMTKGDEIACPYKKELEATSQVKGDAIAKFTTPLEEEQRERVAELSRTNRELIAERRKLEAREVDLEAREKTVVKRDAARDEAGSSR